jgi:hypothetical protein
MTNPFIELDAAYLLLYSIWREDLEPMLSTSQRLRTKDQPRMLPKGATIGKAYERLAAKR